MVQGLSCSASCGIFPDQGWNSYLLHWQADSFPLSHQGSPRVIIGFYLFLIEEQLLYSIVLVSAVHQHDQRCYKLKEGRPRCEL